MKNALLFHGRADAEEYYSEHPSASNSHWFPWLANELLRLDIHAVTPEVFQVHTPTYEKYLTELERFDISTETILVGHSTGAGFLVRWLSENPHIEVNRVALVAPWLGEPLEGKPLRAEEKNMFDFSIDPAFGKRCETLTIFSSTNDMQGIQDSVAKLTSSLEQNTFSLIEKQNMGHFCSEDSVDTFPELLHTLVK